MKAVMEVLGQPSTAALKRVRAHETMQGVVESVQHALQNANKLEVSWAFAVEYGLHNYPVDGWMHNHYNGTATITIKIGGGCQDTGEVLEHRQYVQ